MWNKDKRPRENGKVRRPWVFSLSGTKFRRKIFESLDFSAAKISSQKTGAYPPQHSGFLRFRSFLPAPLPQQGKEKQEG